MATRVRGLAARAAERENRGMGLGESSGGVAAGSGALLREYIAHLRVERGLRPLTCEAYLRDLEMFAEFLEGGGADGTAPAAAGRAGGCQRVHAASAGACRAVAVDSAQAELPARVLSLAAARQARAARSTVNIESPASWKVLPKSPGGE